MVPHPIERGDQDLIFGQQDAKETRLISSVWLMLDWFIRYLPLRLGYYKEEHFGLAKQCRTTKVFFQSYIPKCFLHFNLFCYFWVLHYDEAKT